MRALASRDIEASIASSALHFHESYCGSELQTIAKECTEYTQYTQGNLEQQRIPEYQVNSDDKKGKEFHTL